MPVYTFSVPTKNKQQLEAIEALKKYCERNHLNFSSVVANNLEKLQEELQNGHNR